MARTHRYTYKEVKNMPGYTLRDIATGQDETRAKSELRSIQRALIDAKNKRIDRMNKEFERYGTKPLKREKSTGKESISELLSNIIKLTDWLRNPLNTLTATKTFLKSLDEERKTKAVNYYYSYIELYDEVVKLLSLRDTHINDSIVRLVCSEVYEMTSGRGNIEDGTHMVLQLLGIEEEERINKDDFIKRNNFSEQPEFRRKKAGDEF